MLTIICDLSDVLIKGMEGVETTLSLYLHLPIEKITAELYDFDYHPFWLGQTTETEMLKSLITRTNWNISEAKLRSFLYGNFMEIDGTRQLFIDLGRKYQLILLSVNSPEWTVYLEKKFLYTYLFDHVHYSYEVGYTKREIESFQYILDKYLLKPENVLLIDDSTRNINIAKTIGIDGIKFLSSEQMRYELISRKLI